MNLKKVRLLAGKTQKETADALNLTQNTYSNYENEKTAPDIETLIKLADFFHTTIDNICGHSVPYLLDLSTLTKEQRELVKQIKKLDKEQCRYATAYIEGFTKDIEERNARIMQFYKPSEDDE